MLFQVLLKNANLFHRDLSIKEMWTSKRLSGPGRGCKTHEQSGRRYPSPCVEVNAAAQVVFKEKI